MKIEETRSSKLYASVSWSHFGKKLPILIASNGNSLALSLTKIDVGNPVGVDWIKLGVFWKI